MTVPLTTLASVVGAAIRRRKTLDPIREPVVLARDEVFSVPPDCGGEE